MGPAVNTYSTLTPTNLFIQRITSNCALSGLHVFLIIMYKHYIYTHAPAMVSCLPSQALGSSFEGLSVASQVLERLKKVSRPLPAIS